MESLPIKVLLLGDPNVGKSTFLAYELQSLPLGNGTLAEDGLLDA